MSRITNAVLSRIENLGYRITIVSSARALCMEAVHPATGERFVVHASPNMELAAARQLSEMIGVACDDLAARYPRRNLPSEACDDGATCPGCA